MITIDALINRQKAFDKNYKSTFRWSEKINEDNIEILEYLLLAMVGEFGEAANLIKKVIRGDKKLHEIKDKLEEELIDILIYNLKLIYQLGIDIESAHSKKLDKNRHRFKKYETNE